MKPRVIVVLASLVGSSLFFPGAPAQAADDPQELPKPMRVADALDYLGADAAEVAQDGGLSLKRWQQAAAEKNAWIDESGAMYIVEPAEETNKAVRTEEAPPAVAPYNQTFSLHSNPSATRKLYLDFDGHTISGTAWANGATLVATPFSTDSDPNFSNAELDIIQSAWARVAEDYAPFDIDVTTQDPGQDGINRASANDNAFGTRIVVTPQSSPVYRAVCGGCGGVAYVGTIDLVGPSHDKYQPAWVFTSSDKSIAEAASHEAGHNMGLGHDGNNATSYYKGHGAWAPIMGVGYDRPVSQWSKGEYANARNTEDDFVVAGRNEIPLRADDHGGSANPTDLNSAKVEVNGVIASAGDVDAFKFTSNGGQVNLRVDPADVSPNLDVELKLLNSGGDVVAKDDPEVKMIDVNRASGLGASISVNVPSGTYRVVIDGVGYGNPANTGYSDYGSLGVYTLSGNVALGGGGNKAPTAVAKATPAAGAAPLSVTYSGADSTDSDGKVESYQWTFSDGTTSTAASPTKTWPDGTHTATLVVTDDAGATSSPTTVSVSANANLVVKVQELKLVVKKNKTSGKRWGATIVTVTDADGNPVQGVSVTGSYSGLGAVERTGTTGAAGTVRLRSLRVTDKTGTFTFTIGSLAMTGATYNPLDNLASTVSKSY